MFANFLSLAGINSVDEKRLATLEKQVQNLHDRFPDHIHA